MESKAGVAEVCVVEVGAMLVLVLRDLTASPKCSKDKVLYDESQW